MLTGREYEVSLLHTYYKKNGSTISVVYGQKGVGKTTLLRFFSKEVGGAYFYEARSCSDREQRIQWGMELSRKGHDLPSLAEYDMLLEASRLSAGKGNEKRVIIINEFQHLLKSDSIFMHKLMDFMHYHQSNFPCMVLLCSSDTGWVENQMLLSIRDFAGAIDGLLKVKCLKYFDMKKLYPEFSDSECLLAYSVLGGYPELWSYFERSKPVKDNLIEMLLHRNGPLYHRIRGNITEKLREPAVYNTILCTLAAGNEKLNDIHERTRYSRAKISVYLKNLIELNIVEKVYSFESAGYRNVQKGVYRIIDPYVKFYYKYLFPNMSDFYEMDGNEFYLKHIAPGISTDLENTYCKICKEKINKHYKSVEEWYGKSGIMPIVAVDRNQRVTVCFCSLEKKLTSKEYDMFLSLLNKAKIQADTIILFSEKGFEEHLPDVTRNTPVLYQSIFVNGEENKYIE